MGKVEVAEVTACISHVQGHGHEDQQGAVGVVRCSQIQDTNTTEVLKVSDKVPLLPIFQPILVPLLVSTPDIPVPPFAKSLVQQNN